ncbi:MAG: TnsA endonuclease N-terminal domain-containing protein [Spongiibacteraceae bacterium]
MGKTGKKSCTGVIVRRTKVQRPRRTRATHRILVPSPNNSDAELADSLLERDAMMLCHFCSRIASFTSQPLTLTYSGTDKDIEATPDLEVNYIDNSSELLEIKYADELEKPGLKDKYRNIQTQFAHMGRRYRIITDKQIRRDPNKLRNFRRLLGYRLDESPLPEIDWLPANKPFGIRDLAEKLGSEGDVYRLLARQELYCDFSRLITLETIVRKSEPTDYLAFI